MSDALLKEISTKLDAIHVTLKTGAAASNGGTKTPPAGGVAAEATKNKGAAATPNKPAAAAAANKPAAAAANKPAAAAGPAAGTKGPGGKYTVEQVRDIVRKVAADPNLGRQSAKDILADDGGVEKIMELKPEKYDQVYEACQVLLSGEGAKTAAPAEDDDFA